MMVNPLSAGNASCFIILLCLTPDDFFFDIDGQILRSDRIIFYPRKPAFDNRNKKWQYIIATEFISFLKYFDSFKVYDLNYDIIIILFVNV